MATPINRSSAPRQLVDGLNTILGLNYGKIDGEDAALFEMNTSDKFFEEDAQMTAFGLAPLKSEGGTVFYDTAQEGWSARYEHETIAMGFQITEEATEDNRYMDLSKKLVAFVARSMAATKQQKAANVLNNGFNSGYTGGDGQPLFSASHPTIGDGVQSNTFAVDMSETALENISIAVQGQKDDRGILVGAQVKTIHIPKELKFVVHRILETDRRPGTADNDANALRDMSLFPGGVHINNRFTDTDAFFIKTDITEGLKKYQRVNLSSKADGDFDTGNFKYKARERYSYGWSDWRSITGSTGA